MWHGFFLVIFLLCEFLVQMPQFRHIGRSIHGTQVDFSDRRTYILMILVIVMLLMLCLEPMGWAPLWNGEVPGHRNQYEKMADAILKGQLHLDIPVEPGILELENPYDPAQREGLYYQWDHAYYDGHYYMYFGVVPALLVFAPYQLLTGHSLTTFHGTQLFAGLYIIGLFLMLSYLTRKFFPKMPMAVFFLLSSAIAVMSIWYCVSYPAMYCTAIMSAICLMVWSLYFFIRAVFDPETTWKTFLYAGLGSLCGALVFGCRPTIGLGNILVLPLVITFFKTRKFSPKLLLGTVLSALPYVAVAAGLMWYNYARFDNPFEFGQSYQLTVADQSQYGNIFSNIQWKSLLENIEDALFRYDSGPLDYGVFVTFPILLLPIYALARKESREFLRAHGLGLLIPVGVVAMLVIVAMGILWTPYLLTRYTMDYIWLLALLLFVAVGALYQREKVNPRLTLVIGLLSIFTVIVCICLFLTPYDANYANHRNYDLKWVNGLLKWK